MGVCTTPQASTSGEGANPQPWPAVLRLRGGGGGDTSGTGRGSEVVRCASVNVDRLSVPKWHSLVRYLGGCDPPVVVCAVQHHQLSSWGHLAGGEYVFMANKCGVGPAGGPAGGVGFAVRRGWEHLFQEHEGVGDGPNRKWLCYAGELLLVSVYVQPNASHSQHYGELMRDVRRTAHQPCIWMGDVNVHLPGDAEKAVGWRGMCGQCDLTALDLGPEWGGVPTRVPRKQQRGRPSHIDTVTATSAAMMRYSPTITAIGTGTAFDGDAHGETDHKVVCFSRKGGGR